MSCTAIYVCYGIESLERMDETIDARLATVEIINDEIQDGFVEQ